MYEPYNEELITETRRYWSEYSGKCISREDAIEIIQNLTAYVDLLTRWDEKKHNDADGEPSYAD